MTRCGEIPPLWQICKNLIWFSANFKFTLPQFVWFGGKFHCCKWPNTENTIWSSGHTDWIKIWVYAFLGTKVKSEM